MPYVKVRCLIFVDGSWSVADDDGNNYAAGASSDVIDALSDVVDALVTIRRAWIPTS